MKQAHTSYMDFHSFLNKTKIFLRPDIKAPLLKIDKHLWSVFRSKEISTDHIPEESLKYLQKAHDELEKDATPLMNQIEQLIQDQLFPPPKKNG